MQILCKEHKTDTMNIARNQVGVLYSIYLIFLLFEYYPVRRLEVRVWKRALILYVNMGRINEKN